MRGWLIAVSLCIASISYGQLKPPVPSPSPSELGKGEQRKPGGGNQAAKKNEGGSQKPPLVVEIAAGQVGQLTAAIEAGQGYEKPLGEWIVLAIQAAAAIAVAIFTAVLASSTKRLWQETRRSALAANRSAKAAKKSADVAEMTLTRLERPYLVPIVEKAYLKPGDKKPWVEFRLMNYGRTAAIFRECKVQIALQDTPDKPSFDEDTKSATDEHVILAQRADDNTITVGRSEAITQEQYDAAFARGKRWALFGYVLYEDVFGDTKRRWFRLKPLTGGFRARGGKAHNFTEDVEAKDD